jgi:hypothetical protein
MAGDASELWMFLQERLKNWKTKLSRPHCFLESLGNNPPGFAAASKSSEAPCRKGQVVSGRPEATSQNKNRLRDSRKRIVRKKVGFGTDGSDLSGKKRASGRPETTCQNKNELRDSHKLIVRRKMGFGLTGKAL